ncbi:N-acetylmuramoyl-L-alanine amidase CwlD [Anaerobacterium chartisolvens]|uniref:N-acetylmuramoyl-L-alanine amidase CwlD n=1 Tax=Anaerobacterium chartisolvens TaxID=1297424 RepID=A0A369BKP1_9FIRM|nr:N-acetylmuramoyl-L-alanine amidase [Anaerobacterium chartisolvens]RCX21037.1 N-acetylmuramoyl-L-alanine amidase CwlD [Anaerobacterium chartisolvens]
MPIRLKKKGVFTLSIFICIFLILVTAIIALASPRADVLKKGMDGAQVLQLQKDLKLLGFFDVDPTGYFGDITEASVIKFQKKYNIITTGKAGPITLSQIEKLKKKNKPLAKIVIDPGHGGIDEGASKGGVVEKEVTLDISKRLQERLLLSNYEVVMTRETDKSLDSLCSKNYPREKKDLDARVSIINSSKAKLFVSVHINSLPEDPGISGSIVFYNSRSRESKALASSIQKALNAIDVNGKKRRQNDIQSANFYVLKHSDIPGVLVETAFVTNSSERSLLKQEQFRENLAKAIMEGITRSGL